MQFEQIPGSFRDPSGFLFVSDGEIFRQVNLSYKNNYDHLLNSGLYDALVSAGLLIPHEEDDIDFPNPTKGYKIIKPARMSFISYPYEWCFSQLKNAALTTLKIQKIALEHGMSLKDSSAYNIQFKNGHPILIDTLSFEKYVEGRPWVAYRQFCQHFLAPLALMSMTDIRLNQLLRIYIDGCPLDLASRLLPFKSRFRFPLLSHIHLHAKAQIQYADTKKMPIKHNPTLSRKAFIGIIDSLESAVNGLKWEPKGTEWADYYNDTNYSPDGFEHKKNIVKEFICESSPKTVWDLGANVGCFSRLASRKGIKTVAFDIDPAAVEKNYLDVISNGEKNILPLICDLTNPSPGLGWQNKERMSLVERGPADTVLALALIHHLAISNNLPFSKISQFMSAICRWLIIEFVPKGDSQVQRLLATRDDIFSEYDEKTFEREFGKYFELKGRVQIKDSERVLFLYRRL